MTKKKISFFLAGQQPSEERQEWGTSLSGRGGSSHCEIAHPTICVSHAAGPSARTECFWYQPCQMDFYICSVSYKWTGRLHEPVSGPRCLYSSKVSFLGGWKQQHSEQLSHMRQHEVKWVNSSRRQAGFTRDRVVLLVKMNWVQTEQPDWRREP